MVAGTPDGPRIEPLPIKQWPAGMRDAMAALTPPVVRHPFPRVEEGRSKGLNFLGTLARHSELATAFHRFNGHVLFASSIAPRERELVVLRVAHLRSCEYEWRQHSLMALDNGLDAEEVARVADGPDAPGWSPLDQALVRAVDELLLEGVIGDATWAALAGELDVEQLMDLVFTIGAYETVAFALRSFGVEPDQDLGRK